MANISGDKLFKPWPCRDTQKGGEGEKKELVNKGIFPSTS